MKFILVADTTLFHVAAEYLDDATRWADIARLNGISDPVIVGVRKLAVPLRPVDLGAGHGNE